MDGIIGWLTGMLSSHVFFPLKFDCQHSQAVVCTYLRLFEIMRHNLDLFS